VQIGSQPTGSPIEHPYAGAETMDAPFNDVQRDAIRFVQNNIISGRPVLPVAYSQAVEIAKSVGTSKAMMMVCGPEKMVQSASDLAFKFGFDFHHEEFYF